MSKKKLYDAVKTKVNATAPFNFLGLWNNQFAKEGVEDAHRWPAVYLEFSSLVWSAGVGTAAKLQQGDVQITLHIGFKTIVKDNSLLLNEVDKIFNKLHGLATKDFDPLRRIGEAQNTDYDNVFEWAVVYRTTLKDEGAANEGSQVTLATDIAIDGDLVIDNPVIRTAKLISLQAAVDAEAPEPEE